MTNVDINPAGLAVVRTGPALGAPSNWYRILDPNDFIIGELASHNSFVRPWMPRVLRLTSLAPDII